MSGGQPVSGVGITANDRLDHILVLADILSRQDIVERRIVEPENAPTLVEKAGEEVNIVPVLARGGDGDMEVSIGGNHAEHIPFGAQWQIEDVDSGQPFLVDTSGWAASEAVDAMAVAFGRDPVLMGSGGSIPFIADLVERYPGAQILITGVEDPDARAHSPNESLHLPTFQHAILAEALLLARLNSRA